MFGGGSINFFLKLYWFCLVTLSFWLMGIVLFFKLLFIFTAAVVVIISGVLLMVLFMWQLTKWYSKLLCIDIWWSGCYLIGWMLSQFCCLLVLRWSVVLSVVSEQDHEQNITNGCYSCSKNVWSFKKRTQPINLKNNVTETDFAHKSLNVMIF